jgi:hypothetical protein
MNLGLLLLWIIVFLCLVCYICVSISDLKTFHCAKQITLLNTNDICTVSTEKLIDVSSLPCCVQGGQITASKYVQSIDMVVNPHPTYYLDVCVGYCPNGYVGNQCVNVSYGKQTAFDNCVSILQPLNCRGSAMPVGISDTTLYYGHSATNADCLQTTTCSMAGKV